MQASNASGAYSSGEDDEYFDYDPVQLRLDLLRQRIEKESGGSAADLEIMKQKLSSL